MRFDHVNGDLLAQQNPQILGACAYSPNPCHPATLPGFAAAHLVQVGPEALSMAAVLNKELGLSHERTARVLELGYGLKWSRSGVCRALERLGNLAAPTYVSFRQRCMNSSRHNC